MYASLTPVCLPERKDQKRHLPLRGRGGILDQKVVAELTTNATALSIQAGVGGSCSIIQAYRGPGDGIQK